MSEFRIDKLVSTNGQNGVEFPKGLVGVVTASSGFSGNLTGNVTASEINVTGVLTATSFSGDGSNLTGIDATSLKDSGDTVRVQANTSGAVLTGVVTATTSINVGSNFLNSQGIGVARTNGEFYSGVGTAVGTISYNSTHEQIQVWNGSNWKLGDGSAAAGAPLSTFQIDTMDIAGANPVVTQGSVGVGSVFDFDTGGYIVINNTSNSDITFDMWCWGGGGANANVPSHGNPGRGAAGGGVRGRYTLSNASYLTLLVADAPGAYPAGFNNATWPDGGPGSEPGGGSSRIGAGNISFPLINNGATSYLLIGGGGAGGDDNLIYGPQGGFGGYPSGSNGLSWYQPGEGPATAGHGGTQSAGGAGGAAGRQPAGSPGGKYSGGASGPNGGSGGGGGYYGGGGAGGYYARGGGGSSYINPSITANTGSFDAIVGGTNFWQALDDSTNPGTKPGNAGNGGYGGFIRLKIVSFT